LIDNVQPQPVTKRRRVSSTRRQRIQNQQQQQQQREVRLVPIIKYDKEYGPVFTVDRDVRLNYDTKSSYLSSPFGSETVPTEISEPEKNEDNSSLSSDPCLPLVLPSPASFHAFYTLLQTLDRTALPRSFSSLFFLVPFTCLHFLLLCLLYNTLCTLLSLYVCVCRTPRRTPRSSFRIHRHSRIQITRCLVQFTFLVHVSSR
jgi:hypothetical protein